MTVLVFQVVCILACDVMISRIKMSTVLSGMKNRHLCVTSVYLLTVTLCWDVVGGRRLSVCVGTLSVFEVLMYFNCVYHSFCPGDLVDCVHLTTLLFTLCFSGGKYFRHLT